MLQWPKNCCLLEELSGHWRALSVCEAAGTGTVPASPGGSGGRAKCISATSNTLIQLPRGRSGAAQLLWLLPLTDSSRVAFCPFPFWVYFSGGKDWTEIYEWDNQSEQKKESVWVLWYGLPAFQGVGLNQYPSAWKKQDYAIISIPLNAPQHLRMFLSSWTEEM